MNSTLDLLAQQAAARILGWNQRFSRLTFANSLGAEDMVMSHLLVLHSKKTTWFTLQTGRLHEQTVQLIDTAAQYFQTPIKRYEPEPIAIIEFEKSQGRFAIYESLDQRKACCALRKLLPLKQALAQNDAWFTGLRREQSEHRQHVSFEQIEANGLVKLSPLADWTRDHIWQYIEFHQLPYNPLHDKGYASIGCEPCTRAIRPGEPERSGRWWWEQGHKECGLHVKEHHDSA